MKYSFKIGKALSALSQKNIYKDLILGKTDYFGDYIGRFASNFHLIKSIKEIMIFDKIKTVFTLKIENDRYLIFGSALTEKELLSKIKLIKFS